MVKHKKSISYEMERYPNTCDECPAFRLFPYQCHNEYGMEASCELGFMRGKDMRDFNGRTRFKDCWIELSKRVTITEL
jgi:hypothetical protein